MSLQQRSMSPYAQPMELDAVNSIRTRDAFGLDRGQLGGQLEASATDRCNATRAEDTATYHATAHRNFVSVHRSNKFR